MENTPLNARFMAMVIRARLWSPKEIAVITDVLSALFLVEKLGADLKKAT